MPTTAPLNRDAAIQHAHHRASLMDQFSLDCARAYLAARGNAFDYAAGALYTDAAATYRKAAEFVTKGDSFPAGVLTQLHTAALAYGDALYAAASSTHGRATQERAK